jgi:hypothetical protein
VGAAAGASLVPAAPWAAGPKPVDSVAGVLCCRTATALTLLHGLAPHAVPGAVRTTLVCGAHLPGPVPVADRQCGWLDAVLPGQQAALLLTEARMPRSRTASPPCHQTQPEVEAPIPHCAAPKPGDADRRLGSVAAPLQEPKKDATLLAGLGTGRGADQNAILWW